MTVVKGYEELGRLPIPGDRVKIVDERVGTNWNPDGLMDKYFGTILTVADVRTDWAGADFFLFLHGCSEPGYGRWCWWPHMIDGIVIDEVDEDPAVWTSDFSIDDLLTS